MKQLLLGLMLLMTATAANAEWTAIDSADNFIQYVDRATIRRNGNLVKMWSLQNFKTVQKSAAGGESYLSVKEQWEYDCKEEKKRVLAFSWFDGKMGSGKVVYSDSDFRDKWSPVGPESIGEILWKIACGKQ